MGSKTILAGLAAVLALPAAVLALLAAALALPAAAPAATPRAELQLSFASPARATAATLTLGVVYRAADPNAKPSPIRAGTIDAPAGTRFGGGAAIPACTASDADIRARGREACPPASRVGAGSLTAITGFGAPLDPVRGDVVVFKTPDGFVEVVFQPGTNTVLGMDRAKVTGSRIELHPPATPGGPPDGQTAVHEVRFALTAPGFVVTPPDCPSDGRWRSRGSFTFADGHTAVASAETPCRPAPAPAPGARPRLRLAVAPGRARAGRTTTYRFRVLAARPGCRRAVTIRFAHRRVRTDRAGRAVLRVRARMPGVRTARVAKRGCGSAFARVRVLARG